MKRTAGDEAYVRDLLAFRYLPDELVEEVFKFIGHGPFAPHADGPGAGRVVE